MLARQMIGYAPSLIVTAFVSFASVSIFTGLMSQAEYGQYALAVNAMTMLIGVCFFWLQTASSRLLPQAVEQGNQDRFFSTLYGAFLGCGFVLLVIAAALALFVPPGDWRVAAWFAAPLAVMRALLNLNQSVHRNFVRIGRYNIIEMGQAVIGLVCAVALIVVLHRAAAGAVAGLLTGFAAMLLFDARLLGRMRWRELDWRLFKEIAHFGWPLIITFGFSFILSGSDRFLIEHFLGPEQVGIYSAGYAFPDRIAQNLFMAVATASFPLLVRRLEKEGVEAARAQTYTNGVAILALAVPACIGLMLVNKQVVATLIGKDFRAGATQILPWIALATMLNGIAAHYFDHAFHLAKKTHLFFYTLGPAALLNFLGNLYAIPRYGVLGAAYTTLAAYAFYLGLSIIVGRRVFRIKFPFKPALQIALSTAGMALVLSVFSFPENILGLTEMVLLGGAVYGLGLFTFDVMGVRSRYRVGTKQGNALVFNILTMPAQIEEIAADWQALHQNAGRSVFGGYDWFQVWWRNLGQSENTRLHIATARTAEGELKALVPLVARPRGMLRIVEWAGSDVFDYGDVLADNADDAAALLRFCHAHSRGDIMLVKDIHAQALALFPLSALMRLRAQRKNFFLTLDFASGAEWLASQSRKLRGDIRRKTEKMSAEGQVAFHVHHNGKEIPVAVIEALYAQKAAWQAAKDRGRLFARPEMRNFLFDLAQIAARQGTLYLAWLSCGDKIAACHMGFVQDAVLYLYLTTYDAAYAAHSPGNILMTETIKHAVDHGWRELDFMRGDEEYKQRFASGFRLLSDFVTGRSVAGRLSVLVHGMVRARP